MRGEITSAMKKIPLRNVCLGELTYPLSDCRRKKTEMSARCVESTPCEEMSFTNFSPALGVLSLRCCSKWILSLFTSLPPSYLYLFIKSHGFPIMWPYWYAPLQMLTFLYPSPFPQFLFGARLQLCTVVTFLHGNPVPLYRRFWRTCTDSLIYCQTLT